jgi:hypothetical protein
MVAFLFVYLLVPETRGVTLEQIETNLYAGKSTRHLGDQDSSPLRGPSELA